eukprot:2545214-Prymnesium_polylepis.1
MYASVAGSSSPALVTMPKKSATSSRRRTTRAKARRPWSVATSCVFLNVLPRSATSKLSMRMSARKM